MAFQNIGLRILLQGVGQFNRDVASAERSLNSLGTSLNSASQKSFSVTDSLSSLASGMTRLGMSMTAFVSIPLAGLVTGLVKAGISFEDAFAGISKTVDGVSDSFGNLTPIGEELRNNLRKLALEIPISANELARIGEIAGQLGVPLGESGKDLLRYVEIVAKIGVATDLSTEEAATSFARLANIMGVESNNLINWTQKSADAIVALGNNFATTEPEIVAMSLRFAGVASNAGLTTGQILGLATAVSSLGVQSELGGTTISRIFLEIQNAVNSGGDSLKAFANATGLSEQAFKSLFKSDPNKLFILLVQSLAKLQDQGLLTKDMMTELGLGAVRANEVIAKLGPATDLLTDAQNMATGAMAENLALQEEAQKRFATTASKIQLMKNAFFDLGITVFDRLKPSLDAALKSLTALITGFSDALRTDNEFYATIQKVVVGLIALGPALIAVGTAMKVALFATSLFTTGLTAVSAAIGFILSPIGLIVAAIALLAVAFATDFMGIRTTVTNALEPVAKTLEYIVYWLGKAFEAGSGDGGGFLGGLVEAFNALFYVFTDERTTFFSKFFESFGVGKERAEELGLAIVKFKDDAVATFNAVFEGVRPIFEHIITWFGLTVTVLKRGDFNQALQNILWMLETLGKDIVKFVEEFGPKIASKLFEWGKAFLAWILPLPVEFQKTIAPYITKILEWIGEQLPKITEKLADWVLAFTRWILDADTLNELAGFMTDIIGWILEQVPWIVDTLLDWVTEFISWVPKIWLGEGGSGGLLSKFVELLGFITGWIIGAAITLVQNLKDEWVPAFIDWAGKVWDNRGEIGSSLKQKIIDLKNKLVNFIKNDVKNAIINAAKSIAKGLIDGIAQGLDENAEELKRKISKWVDDNIPGWMKDILGVGSPAKSMIPIGKAIAEGLAQGVIEGQQTIRDAMEQTKKELTLDSSTVDQDIQATMEAIRTAIGADVLADVNTRVQVGGNVPPSIINQLTNNYNATVNNPTGNTAAAGVKSAFRAASVAHG